MNSFIGLLFGLAAVSTVVVLVIGIVSFAVHGPFYQKHSNHLMRLRVLFQGLAILCLGVSVWFFSS